MKTYTVDLGFSAYYATTVHVDAPDVETACLLAVETDTTAWRSCDDSGPTFVWGVAEGAHEWAGGTPLANNCPVPLAFRERLEFSPRQADTILAALRYWQREGFASAGHERDIAEEHGEALTREEIDTLCEFFNAGKRP